MADSFRKVRPGEPLAIPAAAYNAFVDAARESQARRLAQEQGSQPAGRQMGIVFVRNDSGEDRERFDVLGIEDPIFTPTDDEDAFKNQVALKGIVPKAADHTGKFVILLEPVAAGAVGRACIAGVCPAWLYVADEGHTFADVYDGDATMLRSAATGSAQIVWKEDGTGPLWAVVRIGNQVTAAFPAKLTAEDTPSEYAWEEQGLDASGDFVDIANPRFGDGSGGEGDLGLAREFNDAEGLYRDSPTVYVHLFEFTDAAGGKRYRFVLALPAVRWGVLASDWDVNGCPNYVTVNPCDKGGGNPDPATTVKVYIGWPDSGHIAPYFWNLRAGCVIPYTPIGTAGDGTPEGSSYRLWSNPVWGKVINDWQDGQNFVMVRLTDEDGVEIGYAANVKCWLYSPENLANVKGVKLSAGDLIRVELPTYDPGTGISFAHAINVYGGAGKNELLDGANHTDTADADPVLGDLITAKGNPVKWDRLAVGAQQALLHVDAAGLPAWLPKGIEQSILYVNAGVLNWFNAGLAQSMLITGAGGLAWKPHGLNESIYITRAGQLDWLGPGNPSSILYNNAGTLDWLNPPVLPPALLMYDALGLSWFAPGANEDLLVTRNNTFTWLAKGLDPSILVVDNGTVQWSHGVDNTGKGAVLWIDPNGVFGWGQAYHALLDNDWHYDTANALPTKGAMVYMTDNPPNGLWDALAVGGDQAILYVNNGLPAWFTASITVGDSLAIDAAGKLAWRKFNLLDASHHWDTSGTGNLPARGSMIVGAPALDGHICWQELTAGAPGAILHIDNNNDPTWLPKGAENQPLRSTAGGIEWFDGPTETFSVVTDVRIDGVNFQKKTRQLTVTEGLVTEIGVESDWQTFHTGTECPE